MAQPLEASSCLQRMAPTHVHDITVESFEEMGDDKGLSRQYMEMNDDFIATLN